MGDQLRTDRSSAEQGGRRTGTTDEQRTGTTDEQRTRTTDEQRTRTTDGPTVDRRTLIKTVGMGVAGAALGQGLTGSAVASHDTNRTGVRVDQVGYPTRGPKIAVVSSEAVDLGSVDTFSVENEQGNVVFRGFLSDERQPTLSDPTATDQSTKFADFTDLTEPGRYRVRAGSAQSRWFDVDSTEALYENLLRDVGRLFTLHRANAEIDDPENDLFIGVGHAQRPPMSGGSSPRGSEENAAVTWPKDGHDLMLDDTEYQQGGRIDVRGGWYDAGDYGKYVPTTSVTAAQLMLAYERNPEVLDGLSFDVPRSLDDRNVDDMPDVLAEVKYGIKFLTKMQRSDGALFFKVSGERWPSMTLAPEDDMIPRWAFGLSSYATAMACGVFAMAARVFTDFDTMFASQMQEQAEAAFEWLENHPETVWEESVDQNSGSGAYDRSNRYDGPANRNDGADRFWAAAELLRTTGEQRYDDYIVSLDNAGNLVFTDAEGNGVSVFDSSLGRPPIDWTNPATLGHYAYLRADQRDGVDATFADRSSDVLGGTYIAKRMRNEEAFPTGLYDYYWGALKSGVSRGTILQMERDTVGDLSEWEYDWAFEPLHHVLGRSATDYSYVTGHGAKHTENPHSRIIQSQEAADQFNREFLLPGMLIGGPHNSEDLWAESDQNPNTGGSDTTWGHFWDVENGTGQRTENPHAITYLDEHASYATNEWAINYTAPLFFLLAEALGSPPDAVDDGPYRDPRPVPGRIEAENFDVGGPGVSYEDPGSDQLNDAGDANNDDQEYVYRPVSVDFDEDADEDDYHVGDVQVDEWWEYTVDVAETNDYYLSVKYAAGDGRGSLQVVQDGSVLNNVSMADTGGTDQWEVVRFNVNPIHFEEGVQTIRLVAGWDGADFEIDWIEFDDQAAHRDRFEAHELPTRIQAEDFDRGGPGDAYSHRRNYDGGYRDDTDAAIDGHDGDSDYHLGAINTGDWWEYTVVVDDPGYFQFDVQIGAAGSAELSVTVDGEDVGSVSTSGTGGYRNWEVVGAGGTTLSEGEHTVRVTAGDGSRFDLDWLEIQPLPTPAISPDDRHPTYGGRGWWSAFLNVEPGIASDAIDVKIYADGTHVLTVPSTEATSERITGVGSGAFDDAGLIGETVSFTASLVTDGGYETMQSDPSGSVSLPDYVP